jgi:hypothetical protein
VALLQIASLRHNNDADELNGYRAFESSRDGRLFAVPAG